MKRAFNILIIYLLTLSTSFGQVIDVTDLYPDNKYFFPEFEYLGEDAGFVQQRINCLFEDHQGYVWVGTVEGGLFRYDGYTFKHYYQDISDPFSVLGDEVFFIFEDSRNILWVGTELVLCRYDRELDHFQKISITPSGKSTIINNRFTAIAEDEGNNLIIGMEDNLLLLPDSTISRISSQQEPVISLKANQYSVYSIVTTNLDIPEKIRHIVDFSYDDFGTLWGIVADHIGKFTLVGQHQPAVDMIESRQGQADFTSIIYTKIVRKLYKDTSGHFWAPSNKQLIKVIPQQDTSIIEIKTYAGNTRTIIDFKDRSAKGSIFWLGNTGVFPILFETETELFYPLTYESSKVEKLQNNTVSCFLQTRSGVIIAGTYWGGLFKFNPNALRSVFHPGVQEIHLKQPANLRYVFEDSKGCIWIIVRDVYRCDKYTGEILEILADSIFGKDEVYKNKMLEDSQGRFWIAMEGQGLNYLDVSVDLDAQDSKPVHIASKNVIAAADVTALYEDHHGSIWAAAIGFDQKAQSKYSGLYKLNQDGRVLAHYPIHIWPVEDRRVMNLFINQIHMDSSGILWLATGFGLVRFSPETEQTTIFKYPPNDKTIIAPGYRILTLCPDPNYPEKFLWLGTAGGGLICFNTEDHTFTAAKDQDGMPGRTITSLLSDDYGYLWIATVKGIVRAAIDAGGGKLAGFTIYDKSSGLFTNDYSNYYGHNAVKTKNGNLIFTGPKGFQIINPADVTRDTYIPPVHLTRLIINQRPVDYNQPDSPIGKPLSKVKKIRLPHDENTLSFEFTAPAYRSESHIRYAYKLEGFNEDWVSNGSERTFTFTNLPPGRYNLIVKVGNKHGAWGEPTRSFSVQIMHPWWRSGVALVVYLFIMAAVLWLILRFRMKRQQMKLEMKINQMEAEKYKELEAMKSKFFTYISHEFKTPLTLIMNPVEKLIADPAKHESVKLLRIVQRNAHKLKRYINDILELAKLDAGKVSLNPKQFDIVEYTRYLITPFEAITRDKHISLRFKTSAEKISCYLDPDKYSTIITNLLSNAIRFTPENGNIEIVISVCNFTNHSQRGHKEACLMVAVKDSGRGIPKEKLSHVFDRFYLAENENDSSGTGLGLSLVRELVDLHKGTIEVKSEEHQFTEFMIRFPEYTLKSKDDIPAEKPEMAVGEFHRKKADIPESSAPEEYAGEDGEEGEERKIILAIDDNEDMLSILRMGLGQDYKLVEAENGIIGEQKAIEMIPDLIICDVMMPKKDGFEVLRNIKTNEITSHIPFILLTVMAFINDKMTGLELGADEYLVKPFNTKELKVRVKNLLEQREKLRLKYSQAGTPIPDDEQAKTIDQVFLEKVQHIINKNLADDELDVNILTEHLGISRTQLNRKLKAVTNKSANELIRHIRMEKASALLHNSKASISEISYQVGYKYSPYFTRVFKTYFGHNPSEHVEIMRKRQHR